MSNLFTQSGKRLPLSMIGDGDLPDFVRSSLSRASVELNEAGLLECIRHNHTRKTLVYHAVIALRIYGRKNSIPTLKNLIYYPKADTQVCALLAIGAIAGPTETEYYADLLRSKYRHKSYVMAVIWEVGDNRALDAVTKYAEKVTKDRIALHSKSDVLYITEYLSKNAGDSSQLVSDVYTLIGEFDI